MTVSGGESGGIDLFVPSVVERWDGSAFRPVASPTAAALRSFYGRSEKEIWAGGEAGVYLWNGVSWSQSLTTAAVHQLWGSGAGEVWAAGEGGLHYWDGQKWTAVIDAKPRATQRPRSVWGSSAQDVWIGGTGGLLQRWNGKAWKAHELGGDVLAVWAGSPECAWFAVGSEADAEKPPRLVRWDGVAFSKGELEGTRVDRLWGSSPVNVWAVGPNATALQWDGRTWTRHRLNISQAVRDVWGTSAEDMWLVGDAGRVLHWNGTAWTDRSRLDRADLAAIWGLDRERVWVATRAYRERRASHLDA